MKVKRYLQNARNNDDNDDRIVGIVIVVRFRRVGHQSCKHFNACLNRHQTASAQTSYEESFERTINDILNLAFLEA